MKITINEAMFKEQFRLHGRKDQFSSDGLTALYNYLEDIYDEATEYEYNLDVIGLCCEFAEFSTALEGAKHYSGFFTSEEDLNEGEEERQALEFLSDRTTVIPFDGGVIIQNF